MAINKKFLSFSFNHIAFPPKLPGKQDDNVEDVEKDILTRLQTAVQTLKDCHDDETFTVWEGIEDSLKICQMLNEDRFINQKALESTFQDLKPHQTVILHVTQQNAGLLIRSLEDEFIFEAFEASPSAEQTLAAKGAMQWDFPTAAVSLPRVEFENTAFQQNFVTFLERASLESLEEFSAKTRKAGVNVSEARDTANSALITEFLMTLFEVNGNRVHPPVLRKRVKDDVCWDNAKLPWRRSPLWLILRVSVQRLLYLALGEEQGRAQYKFLMVALLSHLLTDCVRAGFDIEMCSFLRAKLCRRLAKLEKERETTDPSALYTYCCLFENLGTICRDAIKLATSSIEERWESFKSISLRKIPNLRRRAYRGDLYLNLPNSGAYLRNVLSHHKSLYLSPLKPTTVDPSMLDLDSGKASSQLYGSFLKRYSKLQDFETGIESMTAKVLKPQRQAQDSSTCLDMAQKICEYITTVGDAYDGNSEQMSIFMLNIFELWVCMDQYAVNSHPLLRRYHPYFKPEMLDVLLLSRLNDMKRLQALQEYICNRCTEAESELDIFAEPQVGCFADRYFVLGEPEKMRSLNQLRDSIEAASMEAREAKENELKGVNREYENHSEGMMQHVCTQRRTADGSHDIRGCKHCWHRRSRRRLKIEVHEDFLPMGTKNPDTIIQKRSILFELAVPRTFSAYRQATWEIIHCFCSPIQKKKAPEMLLKDYQKLRRYHNISGQFSLASTKKSFLGTHYKFKQLPASRSKILLPLGLRFTYYDSARGIWAEDIQRPLSLAHHFGLKLPKELPFSTLYSSSDFAADSNGPSSYDTIASIPECPSDLTIHEYTAHQSLVAGRNRRWFTILTELGSSNVNFSLQDTMVLFFHLTHQAGPGLRHDDLRAVHVVFRDQAFCRRLINQIEQHVNTISQNWRESYYMETLLTLTIRVCSLGHETILVEARALLQKIRSITLSWTKVLRTETRNTQELDVAERSARYGFLAALLCRRTFYLAAFDDEKLDKDSLSAFVEAALAMQENLVVDITKFSAATLNILIRDIKTTQRLSSTARASVYQHPSSLKSAIDTFWLISDANTDIRSYSQWQFLRTPHDWWLTSTVLATNSTRSQVVHYHLLEGHLLIDGRALGRLPADIHNSEILKELFGNQRPVAFPSNLPGMSYVLGIQKNGYYIHLGHRGKELVIQALSEKDHLEFIPSHVFGSDSNFDLPGSLVHDCVHWLDLRSEILEARRKSKTWKSAPGNWKIDLRTSSARRRRSQLVNPKSTTFLRISQIFSDFVPSQMLTVYQPLGGYLSVEIKSMDLIFEVNKSGLLQCRQLSSEIDPIQDAGTFYGLRSMIVLRDLTNPSERSVITPLGALEWKRSNLHVQISIQNDGRYAKYSIDSVLGRLQCPPEPQLLYTKALLHAFTSFVIPDPLTGRTGTEEALRYLQSGLCQPWNPLTPPFVAILQTIANLTPRRQYYPLGLKRQQCVSWDPHLTTTIQHDAYQSVVDLILKKSTRLQLFHPKERDLTREDTEQSASAFLCERACWRRSIYDRPEVLNPSIPPHDFTYTLTKQKQSRKVSDIREILTLIYQKPKSIRTTRNLKDIMREWSLIGGYPNQFTPYSIGDFLGVDLHQQWGGLVNICREHSQDKYNVMFPLGLIAFSDDLDIRIVRTLVAFFLFDDLKKLDFPNCSSVCGLDFDQRPSLEQLIQNIRPFCQEYQEPPLSRKKKGEHKMNQEARELHEQKCSEESASFARYLLQQWPIQEPSAEGFEEEYLDKYEALEAIIPYWQKLYDALQFSNHISEVQIILDRHYTSRNAYEPSVGSSEVKVYQSWASHNAIIPRLSQIFMNNQEKSVGQVKFNGIEESDGDIQKPNKGPFNSKRLQQINEKPRSTAEITELEDIIMPFLQSDRFVRSSYGRDLERSIEAFKHKRQPLVSGSQAEVDLDSKIAGSREMIRSCQSRISDSYFLQDSRYSWLVQANLWPAMNPSSILEQLGSQTSNKLRADIKHELISYAMAISRFQYLNRMKDAVLKSDQRKLKQELANPGYTNWDPSNYPDWLLLEIDANIHIREDQVTVALEMIFPTSNSNSVLQMNMGQGKTSVIMPMVACVLADKKMLARLLVPNALLSQTAQILQSRLGGLVGREVTHVPFSRRTKTTDQHIQEYRLLHEEILNSCGIILAVPEHILSFKLCGLQRISDEQIPKAKQMVAIQDWLNQISRDILDECDFTLATKTQLVYPSGAQLNVDGHPHRWKVTETILDLVAHKLSELATEFPHSIDVIERGFATFPVVHILRNDVEQALIRNIVDDICASRTQILSMREYTLEEQQAIRDFISLEEIEPSKIQTVVKLFDTGTPVIKNLFLLRGLFVHGILLLCLKKRWNVQYGLHPRRDPVAVPFHAKGVPSEQAEWGHPDVAILFTCLAFYYRGLDQNQIRQSLQIVLKCDDPVTEYDRWTQTSTSLPNALRYWNIINVDDEGQVAEIWRHLRFSMVVVNHFLNHFVFPAHAKQFNVKLQASGWDVPLFEVNGTAPRVRIKRPGITTGFSGTNDNRRLLPLTIEQQDLPGLSHTNAEVLTYLLQKRNRDYIVAVNNDGRRFSELNLLDHMKDRGIRVLIDAGAFILEMDNRTLVKEWLQRDNEAKAAVYFHSDKAFVQYQAGKTVSLLSSPFADNLEGCLVYLDEAHTRGTDLKLPVKARGALTLGLNQTKDHTVQAAMRMRQLGMTQSISFVAPPEVHQSIQDVCKKGPNEPIDSSHVVTWLLHQTCNNIEELQPLYFSQGRDFCNRMQAATTYHKFLDNPKHREAFMAVLRQPEQQTLDQLYAPKLSSSNEMVPSIDSVALAGELASFQQELRRRQLTSKNGVSSIKSSTFEEVEQEREVAFQVEEEREVQKPLRMQSLTFPGLYDTILQFVITGSLNGQDGYIKASSAIERTKVANKYGIQASMLLTHLYISVEYVRTVSSKKKTALDNFTRPVNWVLWSQVSQTAIVIIPEEAELVIPLLQSSETTNVHLLLYASPVTRKMLHFDDLAYYAFPTLPTGWKPPSWLSFELGILAGRLYFTFGEYDELLHNLNSTEDNLNGSDTSLDVKNTLAFLNEWLSLRRQGQDITHTPMGYVCHGRNLREDHPFFMHKTVDQIGLLSGLSVEYHHEEEPEDDDDDDLSDNDNVSERDIEEFLENADDESASMDFSTGTSEYGED